MKRLATTLLIGMFFLATAPAGNELLENAFHFVQQGHSAHAAMGDDDHAPIDVEHGCSETLHLCSCCASLGVSLISATPSSPISDSFALAQPPVKALPPGIATSVEHPPQV